MEKLWNAKFVRICLVALLFLMGNQMIMAILPLYLEEAGHAPSLLGTATALSALASMCGRPLAGWLADRRGKRLPLFLGLLLMLSGAVGLILSPLAAMIMLIRALQGFGFAFVSTAQTAVAADALPASQMKRGLTWFGIANTLASAGGSAVGTRLIIGGSYAPVWLGSAAFFGVAAALSLTFAGTRAAPRAAARADAGRGFWRLFERTALFPSALQWLLSAASASIAFLPAYGQSMRADIGLFFAIQAFASFAANGFAVRVIDRPRAPLRMLLAGALLSAAAFAMLLLARGPLPFYLAAGVYGFGNSLCMAVVSALAMSSSPEARRGAASATFQCAGDVGYCVASLLLGVIAHRAGYAPLYGVAMILPVAAAALSVIGLRTAKRA